MQIWLQNIFPQHLLSRLMGGLANSRSKVFKNFFIRWFIKQYGVDMTEAVQSDYTQYESFNDFFTRHLKPELRPLPSASKVAVSPVDGYISELGKIDDHYLFQAKEIYYNLEKLLACGRDKANLFQHGNFATFYLAPHNYHRIHMPITGRLLEMQAVPGKLFSVNPMAVQHIDNLFTRNERVICWFETEIGLMAIIAIGALNVGNIVTKWHGKVTPTPKNSTQHWTYLKDEIILQRGEEMGYFQMGSSVIIMFQRNKVQWQENLKPGDPIKMGQIIASFSNLIA